MDGNRKITQAVINKGIGNYLKGDGGDLKAILASLEELRGVAEFVNDAFYTSYVPTGDIKKTLSRALDTGKVEPQILEKLHDLGACDQDGYLTKKGAEKSITALSKPAEQVDAFNRYLAPKRRLECQIETEPYSGRIEDHYCSRFNEVGAFCIPEKSNVISVIGVAYTWSALKELMAGSRVPRSVKDHFRNYKENPPCYDVIQTDSNHLSSEFLREWKCATVKQISETRWSSFREVFLEVLEKTYWVYTYKYSVGEHIAEFDRLISLVNHEKLCDFFVQKFSAEVGFRGWPDLSVFSENEISVIELKSARDKLKIDQIKTLQKLLNEMPSVDQVKVIHQQSG